MPVFFTVELVREVKMKGCGCSVAILILFIAVGAAQGGLGEAILMGLVAAVFFFAAVQNNLDIWG